MGERSSQSLNLNTNHSESTETSVRNYYKWEDPGRLNKYCMLLPNQKAMKHKAICGIQSVVDEGRHPLQSPRDLFVFDSQKRGKLCKCSI